MSSDTAATGSGAPAWEVQEFGTVWPVEVLSNYPDMFGFWRCRRQDGTRVNVYGPNLRSADNIDVRYVSPAQQSHRHAS